MKKLYLKTLATALLLSLNALSASADEIGTETVNFLTTNSGWSTAPTTSTSDLSSYTYTSSCSTISFSSNAKISTNNTFFVQKTSVFATSNGIEIANCTIDGVITIKCQDGYSIRKISMEYGLANTNGNATTGIFNLCGKNDNSSIETTAVAYPATTTTLKTALTISLESSSDEYFTTVTLNKTGAPFMEVNKFEIEYVKTSTDVVLLDELSTSMPSSTSSTKVQLGRPFSWPYRTLCVPFDATEEQITAAFGCKCHIYSFGEIDENGVIPLHYGTEIKAGTPYLIEPYNDSVKDYPIFSGVTISDTPAGTVDCGNGVSVHGIYVKTAKSDMTGNVRYLTTDNTIKTLSDGGSIKGFRAYFVTSNSNAKLSLDFGNGEVTAIDAIDNEPAADSDAPAYNLAGQRVGKAYKGIVIVNGKKVVRK